MPSLQHNAVVDMFRENPALGPQLLERLFHVEIPAYASVTAVESSLDQLVPIEFRADLVLELRDAAGALVLAIVIEVQRDEDADKKYSWPVYLTVVRAQKRCPTCVLVVALDARVAAWAAEPIDLGLGRAITPLVLGPSSVPAIVKPEEAEQAAELAVLSAMLHGNGPQGLQVVVAALGALGRFDREHAAVYFQVVYSALREPVRRALEELIMNRQTLGQVDFPPFAKALIERGEREGRLQGEIEGRLQGEIEGRLQGKRDVLLRLIARAQLSVSDEERARIGECTDLPTLDRWIDNVLDAKSDLFG